MNAIAAVIAAAATVLLGIGAATDSFGGATASAPAERIGEQLQVAATPPPPPRPTPDGPSWARCPQWWSEARDSGWPEQQLPTLDRVMWCESRCDPNARNRSGASGLMQLMPLWWRGKGDPFNPSYNLTRALYVLDVQGWNAWSCY